MQINYNCNKLQLQLPTIVIIVFGIDISFFCSIRNKKN